MLRVGVHQVPTAQAGLVRALVQLLSRGSSEFRWAFAHEGPYDALIVDSQSPDLSRAELRRAAHALSLLGTPSEPAPADLAILDWPLRAEKLESWLTEVQRGLPERLPAAKSAEGSPDGARYRLRRWPPEALMRGDPQRIRLATLLARRDLSTGELVRLSGQDLGRCRTFLQVLQGFSLLDVRTTPETFQPGAAAVHAPAVPRSGLIQSIRRRLGI